MALHFTGRTNMSGKIHMSDTAPIVVSGGRTVIQGITYQSEGGGLPENSGWAPIAGTGEHRIGSVLGNTFLIIEVEDGEVEGWGIGRAQGTGDFSDLKWEGSFDFWFAPESTRGDDDYFRLRVEDGKWAREIRIYKDGYQSLSNNGRVGGFDFSAQINNIKFQKQDDESVILTINDNFVGQFSPVEESTDVEVFFGARAGSEGLVRIALDDLQLEQVE